jgi:hypothetical protein
VTQLFRRSWRAMLGTMRETIGLFAALLVGCATVPIPADQQAKYFRCAATVKDSTRRLVQDGFQIAASSPTMVSTADRSFDLDSPGSPFPGLRGPHLIAVSAVTSGSDELVFSVRAKVPGGPTWRETQGSWDIITEAQIRDGSARNLLNRLRRGVCGGDEYFGAPTSKQRR